MRFSASLVAFVYLGFAAAAVLPAVPTESTSVPLPARTPDLHARSGVKPPNASDVDGVPVVPNPPSIPHLPKPSAPALPGKGLRRDTNILGDVLNAARQGGKGKGGKGGKGDKGKGDAAMVGRDEPVPAASSSTGVPCISLPTSSAIPTTTPSF